MLEKNLVSSTKETDGKEVAEAPDVNIVQEMPEEDKTQRDIIDSLAIVGSTEAVEHIGDLKDVNNEESIIALESRHPLANTMGLQVMTDSEKCGEVGVRHPEAEVAKIAAKDAGVLRKAEIEEEVNDSHELLAEMQSDRDDFCSGQLPEISSDVSESLRNTTVRKAEIEEEVNDSRELLAEMQSDRDGFCSGQLPEISSNASESLRNTTVSQHPRSENKDDVAPNEFIKTEIEEEISTTEDIDTDNPSLVGASQQKKVDQICLLAEQMKHSVDAMVTAPPDSPISIVQRVHVPEPDKTLKLHGMQETSYLDDKQLSKEDQEPQILMIEPMKMDDGDVQDPSDNEGKLNSWIIASEEMKMDETPLPDKTYRCYQSYDENEMEEVDIDIEPGIEQSVPPGILQEPEETVEKLFGNTEGVDAVEMNKGNEMAVYDTAQEFASRWQETQLLVGNEKKNLPVVSRDDDTLSPSMLSIFCNCISLTWMFASERHQPTSSTKARRVIKKMIISSTERKAALAAILYPLAVALPGVAASDDDRSTSKSSADSNSSPQESQPQCQETTSLVENNDGDRICPMCWTSCSTKRPHFDCPSCYQTMHNDCVVAFLEHTNHQECPCCKTELVTQDMLRKFVRKQRQEDGKQDDPQLWGIDDLSHGNKDEILEPSEDDEELSNCGEVVFQYNGASANDFVESELSESLGYQMRDDASDDSQYLTFKC